MLIPTPALAASTRRRARPRHAVLRRERALVGLLGAAIAAAACGAAPTAGAGRASAAPRTSLTSVLRAMTPQQRVGQLLVLGSTVGSVRSRAALGRRYQVGSLMITGRSTGGVAAARAAVGVLSPGGTQRTRVAGGRVTVLPLVATDQEGGLVQVLSGPGFSRIPSALTQGTWPAATLQARARTWGSQLAAAGVNLDFAPVLDTVPSPAAARRNPPIGVFNREFGFTTQRVTRQGLAFAAGLQSARVAPTVKHFPGLGRVTANTDTRAHVTDRTTSASDVYLQPFAAAVKAGAPYVMVSTAVYTRIDAKDPAAFSRPVVTGLLRQHLGFRGVVVSDDLGQAVQVLAWSPAARAVDFVRAGGDLVLTVTASTLPAMANGLLSTYRRDPAFAKLVDAAVLRVLAQKQRQHLVQLP